MLEEEVSASLSVTLQQAVLAYAPRTDWVQLKIFVPHAAAAHTLRHALKPMGLGLLPDVLSTETPEPLALHMGIAVPPLANPWPVRARAVNLLQAAHPEMSVTSLIPRSEGLLQSLNLLAAYEVTPGALAASVPPALRELWLQQGGVLQSLWASLAAQAPQFLPAGRRASLWRAIEAKLGSTPPQPALWWGPVPHEPAMLAVYNVLRAQGMEVLEVPLPPRQVDTYTAPHPLDEMQQAALWVMEQLALGIAPIAIVASGPFAARLQTELATRFGVHVRTTGGQRWLETEAGMALYAAAKIWLKTHKNLSLEFWLAGLLAAQPEMPTDLHEALAPLHALPGRWPGAAAYAWLHLALQALAPRTETPHAGDMRVQVVPPHRAVGQAFAAIWVAELVEGVWPLTPKSGALSMGQRRTLGLPDASQQATEAAAVLHAIQHQGAKVVLSHSVCDELGVKLTPSRWWPTQAKPLSCAYHPAQLVQPAKAYTLGAWPLDEAPQALSASLLQAILACPYQAYGTRVLGLEPLPPLLPKPDPRVKGTLIHAWLEAALRHTPHITPQNADALVAFMRTEAERLLAFQPPLLRVLWQPRFNTLAPLMVAWWQHQATQWQLETPLNTLWQNGITVRAKADALNARGDVVDYKTGTPPAQTKVKSGQAPQLPLEAWLWQRNGGQPKRLVYLQLKGYGAEPLKAIAWPAAALVAPVEASLGAVMTRYFQPQPNWPAVPDPSELGVLATGACQTCALSGVCRREEAR